MKQRWHILSSTAVRRSSRDVGRAGVAMALLCASAAWAQPTPRPRGATAVTSSDAALTELAARVRAHVTFLADDLLEGREAGTRGHEIAARYIAAQFALAGATPGGRDGGWLQQIELHESRRTGPAEVRVESPSGTHVWTHGTDTLVDGGVSPGSHVSEGDLVFVGYGVVDPRLGIDDYAGVDVRGKVVVSLIGTAPGMDSEVAAHLIRAGRTARERGAVGGLGILTRSFAKVLPWERLLEDRDEPVTTFVTAQGAPYADDRGPGVGALVKPDAAASLFAGAERSLEAVLDEADTPGARPRAFPLPGRATLRSTTESRRYRTPAVIGVVRGTDPVLRDEYVALTAHADHIGVARSGEGDRINNGALDNAMGTAMLIEVARALTTGSRRPARSVLLIAHTAEEKGLLGAHALVDQMPVPVSKVVASVNLDMPVLLHDFTDVVAFGSTHSTMEGVIARAAAREGLALSPDPMPEEAIFVRSDHYAMVKAGIPSVMLMPGLANGGQQTTTAFLGTHYHRPSDDVSLPIDWRAAGRFVRVNEAIIRDLSSGTTAVRWYAGDYFGETFAPGATKAPRPPRTTAGKSETRKP
jgi:hypothetical protein